MKKAEMVEVLNIYLRIFLIIYLIPQNRMPSPHFQTTGNLKKISHRFLELTEGDYIAYWKSLFKSTRRQMEFLLSISEQDLETVPFEKIYSYQIFTTRCSFIYKNIQTSLANLRTEKTFDQQRYEELNAIKENLKEDYHIIMKAFSTISDTHDQKISNLQDTLQFVKGLKMTLILINAVILTFYLVYLMIFGWEFFTSFKYEQKLVETVISLISNILQKTLLSSFGIVLHGASLLLFLIKHYKKNQFQSKLK